MSGKHKFFTMPLPAFVPKSPVSHEAIAARAYQIYLAGKGGSPQDHWFQAEKELKTHAADSSQSGTAKVTQLDSVRKSA